MIRLVTDSSSDLPDELAQEHSIEVVPLGIRFGDEQLSDRAEMGTKEFWDRLVSGTGLPETVAPPAGAFLEAYRRIADGGATGILSVCISSAISGTYQAAVIAAEQMARTVPVRVVDSSAVSMALGFQVLAAARAAARGGNLGEAEAAALTARAGSHLVAALGTLEFLHRGHRVGSAVALYGTILGITPLLRLGDGTMRSAGRVRTRSRALSAMATEVRRQAPRIREVAVLHGPRADVGALLDAVRAAAPDVEPLTAELGPVVGSHTGPGGLGVAYRVT